MVEEKIIYIIPEVTNFASPERVMGLRERGGKIPKLKDVLIQLKKDLSEVGITNWEASIETHLTIGTGSIIPGGEAGIKTTLMFSGKS